MARSPSTPKTDTAPLAEQPPRARSIDEALKSLIEGDETEAVITGTVSISDITKVSDPRLEALLDAPRYTCHKHGEHEYFLKLDNAPERFVGPWCGICIIEKLKAFGLKAMHKVS